MVALAFCRERADYVAILIQSEVGQLEIAENKLQVARFRLGMCPISDWVCMRYRMNVAISNGAQTGFC